MPSSFFDNNDPNRFLQGHVDGQIWASFGAVQSAWQWNLNGMYQIAPDRPWGFNVAGNLGGREGTPNGYVRWVAGLDGVTREISVEENLGDYRNDDVTTVDVRLEKEFRANGSLGLIFSIDGFNILNAGTVLDRYWDLGRGNGGWVTNTISPRIWRLGVRLNWR